MLTKIFSREWLFTTLLVFIGAAVCIRLGIWQLDRLEGRRAFNAQVTTMRAAELLDLNESVPADIASMEWRSVTFMGEYDFANQVAIRNRYYGSEYGYHLITPLLSNGTAVLVDRGWVPADADWHDFDEPGAVTVTGQIRLGQGKPAIGGIADAPPEDGGKLAVWNNLDVENMSAQFSYPILEIYIQPNVEAGDTTPPIPYQPEIELTEGSHFGYALQWFTFAAILFAGYPFYLRRQVD
ncbi:MAG: SURF1 family protein [Anaerolineales bacterium]|jgi:surfeit locus 1 family protein|nr:SURF1 family protein [Anaerolineales bacterium]